jgi:hypothetical protein
MCLVGKIALSLSSTHRILSPRLAVYITAGDRISYLESYVVSINNLKCNKSPAFHLLYTYSTTICPLRRMSQLTLGKVLASAALFAYALANANGSAYLNSLLRVLPGSVIIWAIYKFILYPNLFSPLRHIPTVDGDKWWSPQSLKLYRGNRVRGDLQAQWYVTHSLAYALARAPKLKLT